MRNRYFEENPVLTDKQSALIARMGMRRWIYVGDGPIRNVYSQPGSFSDALFVASYDKLWRVSTTGVVTLIGDIPSNSIDGFVSMAATSNIGTTPAYLFVAAGSSLMCYIENGYAQGTISGTPANNDVVVVGTTYYKFTSGSVNAAHRPERMQIRGWWLWAAQRRKHGKTLQMPLVKPAFPARSIAGF